MLEIFKNPVNWVCIYKNIYNGIIKDDFLTSRGPPQVKCELLNHDKVILMTFPKICWKFIQKKFHTIVPNLKVHTF